MARAKPDYVGIDAYIRTRLQDDPTLSARALHKEIGQGSTQRINNLVRAAKGAEKREQQTNAGRKGGESSGISRGKKSSNPDIRRKAELADAKRRWERIGSGSGTLSGPGSKRSYADADDITHAIALQDMAAGEEGLVRLER